MLKKLLNCFINKKLLLKPCINYAICGNFKNSNVSVCKECYDLFGEWKYKCKKFNCPICFKDKDCVFFPNCSHSVCIKCFKRCYFGDREGEPDFPYPKLKHEYINDKNNPMWEKYPGIKKYRIDWNLWNNKFMIKYQDEEYLRRCPICRK